MAPNADPWRTLGLAPGATQIEIRRAYRTLAKIHHPDAAGDNALPRFLAIQAAYEELSGPGRGRRAGGRSTGHPADPSRGSDASGPREPWRADPARARATGRADGRRSPGARPRAAGERTRPPGTDDGKGRPTGPSETDPGTASGGPGGAARPGPAAPGSPSGRPRRPSSRRGPARAATPGSTSYEGADEEPFEPGWSGATWYGASSGTYWTINPREYADPRKHGPEYQARARRSRDAGALGPDATTAASGEAVDGSPPEPERRTGGTARPRQPADRPRHEPTDRHDDHTPGRPAARPADEPIDSSADRRRPGGRAPRDSSRATGAAGATGPTGASRLEGAGATHGGDTSEAAGASRTGWLEGDRPAAAPSRPDPGEAVAGPPRRPPGGIGTRIGPTAGDRRFRGPLLRRPATPIGRLAMALLGWPPLGVFAAAAIDGSTGCGRYAASCPELSAPGTWIVQAAILLLLLALPRVAAWSAHGAIGALVIGVPSAIALSAAGGTNVRETSSAVLLGVLAIAYLGGVAYAIIGHRGRAAA